MHHKRNLIGFAVETGNPANKQEGSTCEVLKTSQVLNEESTLISDLGGLEDLTGRTLYHNNPII